jgi:hypothetical protein
MKNDFQILNELLIGPRSEVSGRAATLVSDGLKDKLDQFVRGNLSEEQRVELCAEILREEPALELLADMIRKIRPSAQGA